MWTVSSQSQCSRRSSTGTNESRRPEYSNEVESVLLTFSCHSGFITNNNQLNNADSPRDLPSSRSRFATSPQAQKSGLSVLQNFDTPQLLYLPLFCCNFFTSAIEKMNWSLLMSKKASRRWQPQHHSFLRIYLSASPPRQIFIVDPGVEVVIEGREVVQALVRLVGDLPPALPLGAGQLRDDGRHAAARPATLMRP